MITQSLLIKKIVSTASLPIRGSNGAAGLDLAACLTNPDGSDRGIAQAGQIVLQPGQRAVIPTGLAFRVPDNSYGRVGPRSGLAVKHGIDTLAGIVDQDYTGEVAAVLINHGENPFTIAHGDRVAQLVIEAILLPSIEAVEDLTPTDRGAGGFGSTGIKSL